jgi:salicylate hydroxylase
MAVEDGQILGSLLSRLQDKGVPSSQASKNDLLSSIFRLYESIRKRRTEVNVAGAVQTRHYYHLADGSEQKARDAELAGLAATKWQGKCSFNWGDAEYQRSLLGFDVLEDTEVKFDEWWMGLQQGFGGQANGHGDGVA